MKLKKIDYALKVLGTESKSDRKSALNIIKKKKWEQSNRDISDDQPKNNKRKLPQQIKSEINKQKKEKKDERRKRRRESRQKQKEQKQIEISQKKKFKK